MSSLRSQDSPTVAAILWSDLHLSLNPPAMRSVEPDWLEAMARPVRYVRDLARRHGCPVLCAGDVFDRWRVAPELINWALENLPEMVAIPGQHDMPLHREDLMYRSAFETLVKVGKIIRVGEGYHQPLVLEVPGLGRLNVWGYAYGRKVEPPPHGVEGYTVALSHQYLWVKGCGFPGAPVTARLTKARKDLKGHDLLVVGDNHRGFVRRFGGTLIWNCGTVIRRREDERAYHPRIGLLLSTGEVVSRNLGLAEDKMTEEAHVADREEIDFTEFLESLEDLHEQRLDFRTALMVALDERKVSPLVKRQVLLAMEQSDGKG